MNARIIPIRLPVIRDDCKRLPRPCPMNACRYHLEAKDVAGDSKNFTGARLLARMDRRDEAGAQFSCVLDAIDSFGPMTQEEIARELGVTQQMVVKTEEKAMEKLSNPRARLRIKKALLK